LGFDLYVALKQAGPLFHAAQAQTPFAVQFSFPFGNIESSTVIFDTKDDIGIGPGECDDNTDSPGRACGC
jgi:hypothetical protein